MKMGNELAWLCIQSVTSEDRAAFYVPEALAAMRTKEASWMI